MTKHEKKTLTKLASQTCQARDGHECLRCSKTTTLCASHIYPKGMHRKMEYDLDNLKTLCYRCHMHFWHRNPIEAWEWLQKTLPKKRLDRLKLRSQVIDKTPLDYNLLKLYFENELEKHNKSCYNTV